MTHYFLHETRLISLIKIRKSFERRPNISKILRNKQTLKIVTTYPKVGVSCYTSLPGVSCYTSITIVLSRKFAQRDTTEGSNVADGVCRNMFVSVYDCVCLFVLKCVRVRFIEIHGSSAFVVTAVLFSYKRIKMYDL